MTVLSILIGIVIFFVLYIVTVFNGLVTLRNRMREALSDISVQQKRRWDLIPNLIETVKGFAKHENNVFTQVTDARTKAISASQNGNLKGMQAAETALSGALKTVFAVAENYPELKANQNFLHLQGELVDAEDKIQAARRFFNQMVQELNTKIEQFPSNLIAENFGFQKSDFFQVKTTETSLPKVQF